LRAFGGAVDCERDVVGGIVVLVLSAVSMAAWQLQMQGRTRRCLYVLISPKRCSTRKISRLSERLAGRGTMRTCTERDGRCAATLRTDMAGVIGREVLQREMLSCSKSPKVGHQTYRRGSRSWGARITWIRAAGSRRNVHACSDGSAVPNVLFGKYTIGGCGICVLAM